jgi:hypothetical protein
MRVWLAVGGVGGSRLVMPSARSTAAQRTGGDGALGGLMLAVPLTLTLVVIGQNVPHLEVLRILRSPQQFRLSTPKINDDRPQSAGGLLSLASLKLYPRAHCCAI